MTDIDLTNLIILISKFFDKDFTLPEDLWNTCADFIFKKRTFYPELSKHPELLDTLKYLRDVRERNNFTTVADFEKYYERKHLAIDALFHKFRNEK